MRLESGHELPAKHTLASPGARLWRNRDFNIFWGGQTFSVLGDAFALLAMPLLVLQATGSVAQMGLVTATFGVGQLVSGIFAGAIVDRVDRRKLMIACDALRTLLYGAIPLGWWLMGPAIWMIYVVVGLGAVFGMAFQVAYIAAVTNLVDRDQITEANSRLQGTFAVAYVAGPMLAGLVAQAFTPAGAVALDAVTFALSAVSLSTIRLRQARPERLAEHEPSGRYARLKEMVAGVEFIWRDPVMRAVTILLTIFTSLVAGGMDLFIYHLKADMHQTSAAVGVLLGAAGVGSIVSAALAPWMRKRFGFGPCWLGGMALNGATLALIGLLTNVGAITALAIGFTFGETISSINSMSLRQEITPDHLLGRVTSAFWTLYQAFGPIGAAIATAIAARAGAGTVLMWMGLLVLVLPLAGLFTSARERHPEQRASLYMPNLRKMDASAN